MEVVLDDVTAMYVVSPNGPLGAPEAFKKLEDAIDWQLQGRKFYGTELNNEYRASLAILDENEPQRLGFPVWTIPGGKYFKEKIVDWEKHVEEIGPTCERIIAQVNFDNTRPVIEFYRSQKELLLFFPIK